MTVYRRGPSHYYRFWHKGVLYQEGGYPTRKAAGDAEWSKRRAVGARTGPARAILLSEAVERYLAEVVTQHAANERYPFLLLVQRLGTRELASLTSADFASYKSWRMTIPRGGRRRRDGTVPKRPPPRPATVNRDLDYFSSFFGWCQERGLVPENFNPARRKKRRRIQPGEDHRERAGVPREVEDWRPWIILTPEQQAKLWSLFPERLRRQVIKAQLLKNLGVRKRVVYNMRWEQIDWAHRVAHYTSKGKSGVIPLNRRALTLLRELEPQSSGRVFPERTDSTLRKWWRRAREALGLPTLRLHDLRVMFARELHDRGADLKTIQALLQHSTPAMTLRYIPSDLRAQRRAVELLDDGE